jgi:TIR domain
MTKLKTTYDVFVSHSQREAGFASDIARIMQGYGLKVFTGAEISVGEPIEDTIWEALAESQAFIVVVPDNEQNMFPAFELGAAKAWNKPVYAIASNPSASSLPTSLQGTVVYPPSRIEEVAQKIKQSLASLSESETSVLIDEYLRIGEPVDHLLLQPQLLSKLTKQFQKRSGRQVAAEELVRMLLRLRKRGDLRPVKGRKAPKIA